MSSSQNLTKELEFTAPTGYKYTIREQNGADDDILSNQSDALSLRNLSKFISAIVVSTTATNSGKLSVEEAHNLPRLDRYCILFQSRMFSLGRYLEFVYDWGETDGGKVEYSQDLTEILFDYSTIPTEVELDSKPDAIPFYPQGSNHKDIQHTLKSGKTIKFNLLSGASEAYLANLPRAQATKNKSLVARGLSLLIDDKFEAVENFQIFTAKDMGELRAITAAYDPIFEASVEVENPLNPDMKSRVSLLSMESFFYMEGI